MDKSKDKPISTAIRVLDIQENKDSSSFFNAMKLAVKTDNIEQFRYLLTCSEYPEMSITAREKTMFVMAFHNPNHKFIDLLIFDHKIPNNEFTKSFCVKNEWLNKKFEMRNLAISIEQELPINQNNQKKIKV
jgi:hypothetical protein